jgi:hypothetical protein
MCDAAAVTNAGESRSEDFDSRLVATRWHGWIPLDDGRRVRILASMGPFPPARIEVEERPASLVITLFERRPEPVYGWFAIAIPASFDITLPTPLQGRRLVDGVTRFDPNTVKSGGRDLLMALPPGMPKHRADVPIGCSFDWQELTGRAWFDPHIGEHESRRVAAKIHFFSPSQDVPSRDQPEGA